MRLIPAPLALLLAACGNFAPLPIPSPTPVPAATLFPTRTPVPAPDPSPTPTVTASPAPAAPPVVQLLAVGDVMLGRSVGERILAGGPAVPFAGVAGLLGGADLLIANLECAISARGQSQPKTYAFRAPPAAAEALALAGVDVVSVANNHALDYGWEALRETFELLGARNIAAVGAGENAAAARAPLLLERNGLRLAFLAYVDVPVEYEGFDARRWIAGPASPGVAWAEPGEIAADVQAARARRRSPTGGADVVIVLLHAGLEGRSQPTPGQRAAARRRSPTGGAAVGAGAALVLGSHPHVLQEVEHYGGGLIVYSLGNFAFDGFGFPENYSAILSITLTPAGVTAYHWLPVAIEDGLPRPASPAEAQEILARVQPRPR